jgi:hypothetical protein
LILRSYHFCWPSLNLNNVVSQMWLIWFTQPKVKGVESILSFIGPPVVKGKAVN